MDNGFNWWSALETFLAVGAGALASFFIDNCARKAKTLRFC